MKLLKEDPKGVPSVNMQTDSQTVGSLRDEVTVGEILGFIAEHGLDSYKVAKHRLLKNVTPYGYGNVVGRAANAIIDDEAGLSEMSLRNSDKERKDLFAMLLGEEMPYNMIEDSIYTPSVSKDGDDQKYYRSKVTERMIQDAIDKNIDFARGGLKSGQSKSGYHDNHTRASDDMGNVLGNYTLSVGYDEEADLPYVSYYDVWDLNPFSSGVADDLLPRELEDKIYSAAGFSSPEVYGRVYFDPNKYDHTSYSTSEKNKWSPEYRGSEQSLDERRSAELARRRGL